MQFIIYENFMLIFFFKLMSLLSLCKATENHNLGYVEALK